jgi:hypothetical protein
MFASCWFFISSNNFVNHIYLLQCPILDLFELRIQIGFVRIGWVGWIFNRKHSSLSHSII